MCCLPLNIKCCLYKSGIMKNLLVIMCLCIQIVPLWGQSVSRTPHGVKVETKVACVELECFSSSIIRVKKYP